MSTQSTEGTHNRPQYRDHQRPVWWANEFYWAYSQNVWSVGDPQRSYSGKSLSTRGFPIASQMASSHQMSCPRKHLQRCKAMWNEGRVAYKWLGGGVGRLSEGSMTLPSPSF